MGNVTGTDFIDIIQIKLTKMNVTKIVFGSIAVFILIVLLFLYMEAEKYHVVHANAAAIKYAIENQITPDSAMSIISKGNTRP